jgi:hypothetical protein
MLGHSIVSQHACIIIVHYYDYYYYYYYYHHHHHHYYHHHHLVAIQLNRSLVHPFPLPLFTNSVFILCCDPVIHEV